MTFNDLNILIVEDSKEELNRYLLFARECGLKPIGVSSFAEAKEELSSSGFDILLTDIHLANGHSHVLCQENNGFEVIKFALESQPQIVVLAMSHDLDIGIFDKAFSLGISHFFRKPILSAEEISIYIKIASQKKISTQTLSLSHPVQSQSIQHNSYQIYQDGTVISSKQDKFLSGVAKNKKIPLILYGETGTGKEEFAKILHKKRVELEGHVPFVTVNCALLDNDLASSLMFGHKKGAFTGANETTNGYVAAANGGILFLDEVQSLDLSTQRKLLRVLNDGSYNRVGDIRNIHSHFQLVVATTKDLDEEVDSGKMLIDFKYRISGAELFLDPLRERFDELPLLISVFFKRENVEIKENIINEISTECRKCSWQGNIRQLFRVLQRMMINALLEDEVLNINHLVLPSSGGISKSNPSSSITMNHSNHSIFSQQDSQLTSVESQHIMSIVQKALSEDFPLNEVLDEVEKAILLNSMKRNGSITKTHQALKISRNAIDGKRKKYKI